MGGDSLYRLQGLRGADKRYASDRAGQRLAERPRVPADRCQIQEESLESRDTVRRRAAAAFLELRGRLVGLTMASENRMSLRRSLIPLALALFATRCADGPHPTAVQQSPAPAPHFLRWAGSAAPQFTAIGAPLLPAGSVSIGTRRRSGRSVASPGLSRSTT